MATGKNKAGQTVSKRMYQKLIQTNQSLEERNTMLEELVEKQTEEIKSLTGSRNELRAVATTNAEEAIKNPEIKAIDTIVTTLARFNGNQRKTIVAGVLSSITERTRYELKDIQRDIASTNETLKLLELRESQQKTGMEEMADVISSFGNRN